ncbi:MAG TPA: hypothetical protein VHZ25_19430 [Acidobacteriaceae bacterium]|nr:hypothetical protein [Acidobacteriaceae bacterium]
MDKHLHHKQEQLLQSLLAGELPHNLSWDAVVELIGQLGEVQPHGGNETTFVVGSQRAFFKHPHTHSLETEEVSRLRKFLHEAGVQPSQKTLPHPGRVIVVIDHYAAHVYRGLSGSRPESEASVRPYDPYGFHHHLIHRKEAHYEGERVPEESSFYEEIAKDLVAAHEIVVIGHATGKSNASDYLETYLKAHHPTIAARVIATETADLSALTEREIEEIAKKHAA